MRRLSLVMTVMILCLPAFAGKAQNDYHFIHINSSNSGLSYDAVSAIFQDSRGFMWIGTFKGLNRYDGICFRTHDREELGLASDFIHAIEEDGNGNIWIGTDAGVSVYDYDKDRFRPLVAISDKGTSVTGKVNSIVRGKDGRMWLTALHQGLFSYDVSTDALVNYFVEDSETAIPQGIRRFVIDHNHNFWFGIYYDNLYYSEKSLDSLHVVELGEFSRYFKGDNFEGLDVSYKANNILYAVTVKRGLCEIDTKNRTVQTLLKFPLDVVPLRMCQEAGKCLWISTTRGLYRYDLVTGTSTVLRENKDDKFALSDNHVYTTYIDRSGGVWVGTRNGGLNYSSPSQQNFEKFNVVEDMSLTDCVVKGFAEDPEERIWIATEKRGLFTLENGIVKAYEKADIRESISSLCYDDGLLWLGTLTGLIRLDVATGKVRRYHSFAESTSVEDSSVGVIYRSDSGQLYVGTTLGLMTYDRKSDAFVSVEGFEGSYITGLSEDSKGTLWVSTDAGGVFSFDRSGTEFRNYSYPDKLPTNKVSSIFVDSWDRIWAIGFSFGFFMYDKDADEFVRLSRSNISLLPTDVFLDAEDDENGNLWLSSDKGLVKFNPESFEVVNYTENDGLLNNHLNSGVIRASDGTFYFGSKDGFIRFHPDRLGMNTAPPYIAISGFRIGDKIVGTEEDSPLDCNVDVADEIKLKWKQNSFGFTFSVLSMSTFANNRIQCFLHGYDEHPVILGADNSVFWYNVNPGTYHLEVKGTNTQGIWNAGHKSIKIIVKRPFYLSSAAIVLYVFIVLLTALLVGLFISYRNRRKEQEKMARFEKAKDRELLDEKMSFFSHVIHEIKTPVSLITAPVQHILSSVGMSKEELDKEMKVISSSTEYLGILVKELLDFISVEKHGYVLDKRNIDVIARIDEVLRIFSESARDRNLVVTFNHEEACVLVGADSASLSKILNNLMHNALKYADTWIMITVKVDGEYVEISVSNDGPKIPESKRTEIFKPFVKFNENSQTSSQSFGIGLSLARKLSELHGGSISLSDQTEFTEFVVRLPFTLVKDGNAESNAIDEFEIDSHLPVILLVEDNKDLALYLKEKFSVDYNVFLVSSVEKALRVLNQHKIDLVLTDIGLVRGSGVQLCKRIYEDTRFNQIPVIVLSAVNSVETKIQCMEYGVAMYVEKPFTLDYLMACIRNLLDKEKNLESMIEESVTTMKIKRMNLGWREEDFLNLLDKTILDNINNPDFDSQDIEKAMGLSRSTLVRRMKSAVNMTPNEYLKKKRLAIAAKMLKENDMRVNEVCYAVGFKYPTYFTRCFKEEYGVPPAEYGDPNNRK